MANKRAVLGRPLPDASLPRNAFDRSFIRNFSYQAGLLNLAFAKPCIAGSKISLNRKIFQRTADVETAAFPTIDTHLQFYFVPMRQMMSNWDNFKLNIQDENSSLMHTSDSSDSSPVVLIPSTAPYFKLGDVKTFLQTGSGQNSYKDIMGFGRGTMAMRLLNQAGYGNFFSYTDIVDQFDANIFPLLAYHKVYYDHFRNSAYESNNPFFYNSDYYAFNSGNKWSSDQALKRLLTMHYVNYRGDYFQNIYPALNYVQTGVSGSDWGYPNSVVGAGSIPYMIQAELDGSFETGAAVWPDSGYTAVESPSEGSFGDVYSPSASSYRQVGLESYKSDLVEKPSSYVQLRQAHTHSGGSGSGTVEFINPLTSFGVQQIRAMFALDKLMRSSAYAPKHAKQQYEARYGIKFRENPLESTFIGSFMNDVVIGEVTSTANTISGANGDGLGAIGGKGIGSSDWNKQNLEYNCPEDGYVIGVMYSLPRTSYDSDRIDSYLLKTSREDFFMPEFMDMGLQPITQREFRYGVIQDETSPDADDIAAYNSRILGYVPRYQEYKLSVDENLGYFAEGKALSKFVVHTNKRYDNFISTTTPTDGVSYDYFKVSPSDLDSIFVLNADGSYDTDQFFTWLQIGFTSIQNMSVHGQPKL